MHTTNTNKTPLKKGKGENRKLSWRKLILFVLTLFFAILIGGFLSFASHIKNQSLPTPVPNADGIVVWTGPGGKRLETAARLFKDGHGERLLISGVNETTSRGSIEDLLGLEKDKAACCLDLDYEAIDTFGNARETAAWAKAMGYEHILLVTSAYHMPRAQMEIQNRAGRIKITPYPVISADPNGWWKNRKEFDRYTREYGKLLRAMLLRPRENSTEGAPMVSPPTKEKS